MTARPSIWKRITEAYTVSEAIRWLTLPHPQLEGEKPGDLIRQGRAERVHGVLDRLDSGTHL